MKILGIESSAKAASVCAWEDGKILAETFCNNGLTHSRTLLVMIENMLKQQELLLGQFDKIAVASGPGSFTGLRIGAAVAKGLSWSSGVPCVGVSTLKSMAQAARGMSGVICAVMDARAGQVYNALFRASGDKIERVTDDRAVAIDDLVKEVTCGGILIGDGAELCAKTLHGMTVAAENIRLPRAWGVCECAKDVQGVAPEELELKYLRIPQAERERLARLKSKE
ncbi:MAG: tRNA (adenosine(37)-N6)-threonylcarbamoyltransferase complex dimerization subunit type 1 TsaB [Clostridia bacterium]